MNVYDALYQSDEALQRFNLVHEQAHVWDAAAGGKLSWNMMAATGSSYPSLVGTGKYRGAGAFATDYHTDHREDWAETVAAAVYPEGARAVPSGGSTPLMGSSRQNYIKPFLPRAALFDGRKLPTTHRDRSWPTIATRRDRDICARKCMCCLYWTP